jgi:hypothetical protein
MQVRQRKFFSHGKNQTACIAAFMDRSSRPLILPVFVDVVGHNQLASVKQELHPYRHQFAVKGEKCSLQFRSQDQLNDLRGNLDAYMEQRS